MSGLRALTVQPGRSDRWPHVFGSDGEMARICRGMRWAETPVGPVEEWSPSLRATVSLLMSSPTPMLLLHGEQLTQIYNDGYRMLMDTRHPHALGAPVRSSWPDGWQLDAPSYERAMGGEAVVAEDVHFTVARDDDREDATFRITYSPVWDDAGVVDGVLVSAFETTRLIAAEKRAKVAARAKADFLAVMSHELRTPLNAIGGYAELLELGVRGPVTQEQKGDLERIRDSQQQLLEVINGVLSYAKAEAGIVEFTIEDIPLDELLARCVALVGLEARQEGLTLMHDRRCTGLHVRGDEEMVQQIVVNLLSNAIKFTPAGGVITLACAEADAGGVGIRVSDTGHGIASADVECIFQPFVQVDAKMTRVHEGTGLGLAIARQLARQMGGELSLESVEGEGSTFTLVLPCGRGECPE